ncbi:hypothetical protein DDZ13_13680 [Coraliomargarita sinensis]|uniref:Exostosin GT47 domain-containing protein n=1 Tax=Coraliomargarita sinensis TaxID=2174842 RepID=A0A317ZFX7_9BACT|nr:exostosin family protein [Coraliomargarita sinensis]PXA03113.1 hypothetical protein DDZ13_13680 [Coraliomargarita sinensis]
MKLQDFQCSGGIPVQEQILTVDNPEFGSEYFRLDVSNPVKWRAPTRTLKRNIHRLRLNMRDRSLSLEGLKEGRPIYLCNSDGRIESAHKIQLPAARLKAAIQRHVIVLGKSDVEINDALLEPYQGSRVKLYGNNLNTNDELAGYFPMGRDFRGQKSHGLAPQPQKANLVYCNFSLDTHPVRSDVWAAVRSKPFVHSEHMGEYRKYALSHEAFYGQLRASKFCISPRGNAIETFRMWDSMYVGTIPIVVREAKLHDELNDLPILFLEDYKEFADLNEAVLEQKYKEFSSRNWNYEKLKIGYWRARINESARELATRYTDN